MSQPWPIVCDLASTLRSHTRRGIHWTNAMVFLNVWFMASVPKNSGSGSAGKAGGLPFEEALKKLESIVEAMESEELPLETLMAKYEEGTKLTKACQEKLSEAELKIRRLEKTDAGELKLKPMTVTENEND